MKIDGYELDLIKRIEPSLSATFVQKRDILLVAREKQGGKYELELIRLNGFKSLKRHTVDEVASVMRVGEKHVLSRLPVSFDTDDTESFKQAFEIRTLKDFRVVASFEEDHPGHIAAHPDGSRIAVAHDFGNLHVRDGRTGELVSIYASKGVGGVAYSPDGKLLAAKEFTGKLRFLDAVDPDLKPLRSVTIGRETAIAFHPQAPQVAAADRQAIRIVDAGTAQVSASIKLTEKERTGTIKHMAYSPDGRLLVTATRSGHVVGLWDMHRAEFIGHIRELDIPLSGVEFDANGEYLLVSSYEAAELYTVAAV